MGGGIGGVWARGSGVGGGGVVCVWGGGGCREAEIGEGRGITVLHITGASKTRTSHTSLCEELQDCDKARLTPRRHTCSCQTSPTSQAGETRRCTATAAA